MADADKRALELTLAIAGLDENTRQSAMRVRSRAFDEAGARTANWDALDEAARLTRALELGGAALGMDAVMAAAPRAVNGAVEDEREWRFLNDRGLFNCAALYVMALKGRKRTMLRLESEMDLPVEWWSESAFDCAALGRLEPIVLATADPKHGTREYINLATDARMIDEVKEQGGTYLRAQTRQHGAIDAPIPDSEQLARATDQNAKPDERGGNVWLLLVAMLACGAALYGLYSLIFSLIR